MSRIRLSLYDSFKALSRKHRTRDPEVILELEGIDYSKVKYGEFKHDPLMECVWDTYTTNGTLKTVYAVRDELIVVVFKVSSGLCACQ